jgi:hypothetical protein
MEIVRSDAPASEDGNRGVPVPPATAAVADPKAED